METSNEEVSRIKNHLNWPLVYALPMKKRKPEGGWPDFGVILAADKLTVILSSIDGILPLTMDEVKELPTVRYPTVEAMVADGWVVD